VRSRELNAMMLTDPFQLEIFYNSSIGGIFSCGLNCDLMNMHDKSGMWFSWPDACPLLYNLRLSNSLTFREK